MQIDEDRIVGTLQELIRIPSVTGSEGTISKFIQNEMEALGLLTITDEVGNVYVELGEGEKSLMLNAHLDTVPPSESNPDPFSGVKKGEKVMGLGASDCKAGLATMMEIARILEPKKLGGKLILAFTVAEEALLQGTRLPKGSMYAAEKYSPDGCIVLEPTMYNGIPKISAGCRGRMILEIGVRGLGTHSSRPHTGKNAIDEAVKLALHIKSHELNKWNYFGNELPETLSIVKINSDSSATNVIPSICYMTLDYRTLPGRTDVRDKLVNSIKNSGVDATIKVPYFSPGYVLNEDSNFLSLFRDHVSLTFSSNIEVMVALGRADSEYFFRNGTPAIIFGPGENHQCHKPEEYVLIPGLVKSSEAILSFTRSFLASSD